MQVAEFRIHRRIHSVKAVYKDTLFYVVEILDIIIYRHWRNAKLFCYISDGQGLHSVAVNYSDSDAEYLLFSA